MDPNQTRLEREFKFNSPLLGCRFDPTDRYLFVSAQDNTIQRCDLSNGSTTAFVGHPGWLRAMACIPGLPVSTVTVTAPIRKAIAVIVGGSAIAAPLATVHPFTLFSGDYHGKLFEWQGDSSSPKPIRTIDAHAGWIRAVAVSPDGKVVATCGNDKLVKLWSVAEGKRLQTLEGHKSQVYNVAFHPTDPNRLLSGDLTGIIHDWDLAKGTVSRELDAKALHKYDASAMTDIGGIRALCFDAKGSKFACAGITSALDAAKGVGNPLVLIFDWTTGKSLALRPKEAFQGTAWGAAFHPDGTVIAAGGGNQGRIWFWRGTETKSIHTVPVASNARDMALAADGSRIAVACHDGVARIYSTIAKK